VETRRLALPTIDLDRIPPYVSIGVCASVAAIVFIPLFSLSLGDFHQHVKPWLDYIRSNGGFAALADNFSEYAPPYLYLLTAASELGLPVGDQTLVKLINVPFVLLILFVVFKICRHFDQSRNRSFAAASGVLLLPTVGANAFAWGQADTIYVPFLLLAVLFTLTHRPYWAMAAFAASVSIKLQGIFLAPFMLFMIVAGHIPWRAVIVAPIVYALSILPAALLGRPLTELLTIYFHQGRFYHSLSMNSPNFYFFLDYFLGASRSSLVYKCGTILGLLLASAAGALIALLGFGRRTLSNRAILLVAALSMVAMPYLLPKMHDRFFFGADVFTYVLACVDRRFIWAAVGLQISSCLSYVPQFVYMVDPNSYESSQWTVAFGAVINSIITVHLAMASRAELVAAWDFPGMRRRLQEISRATFGRLIARES
jgi:Gpi18-like mannosyltransferase